MTAEHAKTLAEITKIGETDPKAADAALQSLRRAREAEVSEAEAPSDLESLGHRLGDLEVGAGEIGGEVIEHLGELNAAGEQIVEGFIAVAAAYENQTDKPVFNRTVEIRKYLVKHAKRGGARPAACKEFSVDPADPLAVDKVKVAYKLKRGGKTLADLESFHPSFWSLPLETDDFSDSRKLVLSRFLRGRETETERQQKREAKIAAKGWPADYYDRTSDERRTINKRIAKQRAKAGLA
jgi:hypothetical protein